MSLNQPKPRECACCLHAGAAEVRGQCCTLHSRCRDFAAGGDLPWLSRIEADARYVLGEVIVEVRRPDGRVVSR